MTTRRVVVGVDGSPQSVEALHFAAREAKLRGATLHVISSYAYPYITLLVPLGPEPPTREQLRADALETIEQALAQVAESDPAIVEIETVREAVEATPVAALLEAAAGADLLVVGARGRGGFAGLRLGSVSQQCAQHAPCPVVIVPAGVSTGP